VIDPPHGFGRDELATLRLLKTPERIQTFLDSEIGYNKELQGATCRSPRRVLRDRLAHCMEGALFGAAALRVQGFPPLLMDLEAVRDDDHVLAIFRQCGHWGAIAKSNYSGLRFREPVYRTLRELAISYFEHYYGDHAAFDGDPAHTAVECGFDAAVEPGGCEAAGGGEAGRGGVAEATGRL